MERGRTRPQCHFSRRGAPVHRAVPPPPPPTPEVRGIQPPPPPTPITPDFPPVGVDLDDFEVRRMPAAHASATPSPDLGSIAQTRLGVADRFRDDSPKSRRAQPAAADSAVGSRRGVAHLPVLHGSVRRPASPQRVAWRPDGVYGGIPPRDSPHELCTAVRTSLGAARPTFARARALQRRPSATPRRLNLPSLAMSSPRTVGPRSVVWHSDGTHASLGTECYSPGWTSEGGAATPSSERARRRSHYGTPTRYAFDVA